MQPWHWMQTTDIITNKSIGMDKERTGMLLLSKEDIKKCNYNERYDRSG